MSRGLNKVLLIGNLGRDPEMRYTPTGVPVTTFSLATTRTWVAGDGDRREATEWFQVVAWRRLAEICNSHLVKGSRIYLEGRIQTRAWDDGEGNRHQRVEIVAQEMIILDGAQREGLDIETYLGGDDAAEHEHDAVHHAGHDDDLSRALS